MLRLSLLLQPPPGSLPGLPCRVVLSVQRGGGLELWLSCPGGAELAQALLTLSDAGCAVVAVGLLSGRVVSPLALLSEPGLAEADPLLSGTVTVECVGSCAGKLRELLPVCAEARWSSSEPGRLHLRVKGVHVSELFERQLRVVEPFRAPP
jgi:hypothetical protein